MNITNFSQQLAVNNSVRFYSASQQNLVSLFHNLPQKSDAHNFLCYGNFWFNLDGAQSAYPPLAEAVAWQVWHAMQTLSDGNGACSASELFYVDHLSLDDLSMLYLILNSYHQNGNTQLSQDIKVNLQKIDDRVCKLCSESQQNCHQIMDLLLSGNNRYYDPLIEKIHRKFLLNYTAEVALNPQDVSSVNIRKRCETYIANQSISKYKNIIEKFNALPTSANECSLYHFSNFWFNLNGTTVPGFKPLSVAVVEQIWKTTRLEANGLISAATNFSFHHLNVDDLSFLYRVLNAYQRKHKNGMAEAVTSPLNMLRSHMTLMCIEHPNRAKQLLDALSGFDDNQLDSIIHDLRQTIAAHNKVHKKHPWYTLPWFHAILEGDNGPTLALGAKPLQNLGHHNSLTAHYGAFVSVVENYELTYSAALNVAATPAQLKANKARQFILNAPDGKTPLLCNLKQAVDFIHENIAGGRPVYVHCGAGGGRSPIVVACYLAQHKRHELNLTSAVDAVAYIKKIRRVIGLKKEQMEIVHNYWNTYVVC